MTSDAGTGAVRAAPSGRWVDNHPVTATVIAAMSATPLASLEETDGFGGSFAALTLVLNVVGSTT